MIEKEPQEVQVAAADVATQKARAVDRQPRLNMSSEV